MEDAIVHKSKRKVTKMKEQLNSIRNVENKYGLTLFRMGLSHLVDVGVPMRDCALCCGAFKVQYLDAVRLYQEVCGGRQIRMSGDVYCL